MSRVVIAGPVTRVAITTAALSSSGASVHNDLTGRTTADSHPVSAITGLRAELDAIVSDIETCATAGELATVAANLAGVIADLAAHLESSAAHTLSDLSQSGASTGQVAAWNGTAWAPATPSGLPSGGALNRTLRHTGSASDWSGRAIRAADTGTENTAAELIVAASAMPSDRHGLQVKYGDSQVAVIGGSDNGIGTVPLFCVYYSGVNAWDITGIYRVSGAARYGIGAYSHSFAGGQFGFGHYNAVNLCSPGVDAPAAIGGNTYLTIPPAVSAPSATASTYAAMWVDGATGSLKYKKPDGTILTVTMA